jgi:hypothetical protein
MMVGASVVKHGFLKLDLAKRNRGASPRCAAAVEHNKETLPLQRSAVERDTTKWA